MTCNNYGSWQLFLIYLRKNYLWIDVKILHQIIDYGNYTYFFRSNHKYIIMSFEAG